MSYRLGVFGGMFDPVHKGHIEAACHASKLLKLDKLKLIPCHTPNHRDNARASGKHRMAMLNLAIGNDTKLEADPIELHREGVSYMVDTLIELGASGEAVLILVLGMDAFNSLPAWHRFEEFNALCHLLVLARAGEKPDQSSQRLIDAYWQETGAAENMFASTAGCYFVETNFDYKASSTDVREQLAKQTGVTSLLDKEVVSYIEQNGLYAATEKV